MQSHLCAVSLRYDDLRSASTYADIVKELTRTWQAGRAWLRAHPFWVDLTFTLFALLIIPVFGVTSSSNQSIVIALLLSSLLIAPLAIRRSNPVLSVVIIYSIGLALLIFRVWELPAAAVAVPIALYSVTLHGPRWAYRTALIGGLVGMTWLTFGTVPGDQSTMLVAIGPLFFSYMFFFTIWAIALVRRSRRETVLALMERATQLEIERDQQHQLATAAERTRIAREMHDIVAHSLSVIIAQADGGHYIARQDQVAAERVLGTIAETGRDALADMRRLLGVLRPEGTPPSQPIKQVRTAPQPTSGSAPRASDPGAQDDRTPQPRSGDLDTLIGQVRASGVRISFVRMGTSRQLPPGVGLAVYRICQESLTNVLKHAGPDPSVTVLLRWAPEQLILDVSDDGRGASADSDGAGQGLLGMAERASMFGGTFSSGPRAGGGFRIHLELPIPAVTSDMMTSDDTTTGFTLEPPLNGHPGPDHNPQGIAL